MAKRSTAVRNLSLEDLEWLKIQAETLGCDVENYVRILIRQRRAAIVMAPPPTLAAAQPESAAHASYYDDAPFADSGEPYRSDVEVPRDPESGPELDKLLRNAPSILDQATAPRPQRQAAYNGHPPARAARTPRFRRQEPQRKCCAYGARPRRPSMPAALTKLLSV
jgi:hypothetical protein